MVELTVAIHAVFDTPNDRLLWDVGHQAYPHKILTGRRDRIRTLRQSGGLSGFTKRSESEYDPFGAAHSSTSISAGLGMAVARDLKTARYTAASEQERAAQGLERDDRNVICVIGDGAMSAGMAYEAMNNAGALHSRLIVVLNDNDMSIAPPVGAMSAYLSRLMSSRSFLSLRELAGRMAKRFPRGIERTARRAEEYARGILTGGTLFEELGFYYVGPIDGHNLDHLLPVLRNVREAEETGPILVHCITQKGKGYAPADEAELVHVVATSAAINDRPSAFRYPRGEGTGVALPTQGEVLTIGQGRVLREGSNIAILSLGTRLADALKAADELAARGFPTTVADARFAKPIDTNLIEQLARDHEVLITIEEASIGGFSAQVMHHLAWKGLMDSGLKVRPMVMPDLFIDHDSQAKQLAEAGLSAKDIVAVALAAIGVQAPLKRTTKVVTTR